MNQPCSDRAADLASLALGALTPEQALAVQAHVDGCRDCAATLAEHRAVVVLLDQADVGRLDHRPRTPAGLDSRVIDAVVRDRASQRRRSLMLRGLVAAASVLVLAGVAGVLLATTREAPADSVLVVLSGRPSAQVLPGGTATVQARPWGTAIDLAVSTSEPGVEYRVWLATADGSRTPAGTFTGQGHPVTVSLASALATSQASTLGISTSSADPLLEVTLPDLG